MAPDWVEASAVGGRVVGEPWRHVCDPWCLLGPPVGSLRPEQRPPLGVWSCLCLERDWVYSSWTGCCASVQVTPLKVGSLVKEEKGKGVPGGLLKETLQKDSDSLGGLLWWGRGAGVSEHGTVWGESQCVCSLPSGWGLGPLRPQPLGDTGGCTSGHRPHCVLTGWEDPGLGAASGRDRAGRRGGWLPAGCQEWAPGPCRPGAEL